MKMNLQELYEIKGGIKFSVSFINYLSKAMNTLLELGRSLGTAIRRISSKKVCR